MKTMSSVAVSLALMVIAPAWTFSQCVDAIPNPNIRGSVPFEKVAGNSYMDRLDGDAASKHLDNLRARHPGVFERAAATLRARGYKDTGKVTVLRANRTAVTSGRRSPSVVPVDTVHLSEGEVVLWEW